MNRQQHYYEKDKLSLQEQLQNSLGSGSVVSVQKGPNYVLDLNSSSGFSFGTYWSQQNWVLDLGFAYVQYPDFPINYTYTKGLISGSVLSTANVSTSAIELLGGYELGLFKPYVGFRRDSYLTIITASSITNGIIVNGQSSRSYSTITSGVAGMAVNFPITKSIKISLSADYSKSVTADSAVESAWQTVYQAGLRWGGEKD